MFLAWNLRVSGVVGPRPIEAAGSVRIASSFVARVSMTSLWTSVRVMFEPVRCTSSFSRPSMVRLNGLLVRVIATAAWGFAVAL